jgi:hypothetical protein
MAQVIQMPAAVVRPRTSSASRSFRMAPAPRKPTQPLDDARQGVVPHAGLEGRSHRHRGTTGDDDVGAQAGCLADLLALVAYTGAAA